MAERRMFAKSIVLSDAFLDMPLSAQCLYFHLGMRAKDKGILNNARSIEKCIGATDEDLKTLISYGFLKESEEEYIIVHWYENNGVGETAKKRNNYTYRQWRKRILERDKVCQICGSDKNLEVHHIKPFAEYTELRTEDRNGVVLCKKCHRDLHRR